MSKHHPKNVERAEWAQAAIDSIMAQTGCDFEDSLGDLLCDLMHWANQNDFDFDAALTRAEGHYEAELEDPEG